MLRLTLFVCLLQLLPLHAQTLASVPKPGDPVVLYAFFQYYADFAQTLTVAKRDDAGAAQKLAEYGIQKARLTPTEFDRLLATTMAALTQLETVKEEARQAFEKELQGGQGVSAATARTYMDRGNSILQTAFNTFLSSLSPASRAGITTRLEEVRNNIHGGRMQ